MFGAVVAGAEFENHFQHMLFSHSLPFIPLRCQAEFGGYESYVSNFQLDRWSFSGNPLFSRFSRMCGCWGYLILLIISDLTPRLGVSENGIPTIGMAELHSQPKSNRARCQLKQLP